MNFCRGGVHGRSLIIPDVCGCVEPFLAAELPEPFGEGTEIAMQPSSTIYGAGSSGESAGRLLDDGFGNPGAKCLRVSDRLRTDHLAVGLKAFENTDCCQPGLFECIWIVEPVLAAVLRRGGEKAADFAGGLHCICDHLQDSVKLLVLKNTIDLLSFIE